MYYRFWVQRSQPPVTELDDGWEVLSDPRWPGGLYRQRSEPHHSAPRLTPKAVAKRHPLGAFGNQAGSAKGSAVDLMV
jgi:hypothetical protein